MGVLQLTSNTLHMAVKHVTEMQTMHGNSSKITASIPRIATFEMSAKQAMNSCSICHEKE